MEPYTGTDALPPRSLRQDFDRMVDTQEAGHLASGFAAASERLRKHRDFVRLVYELSAGGPPLDDLIVAIESGLLDGQAVAHLLYGMPFHSWTEPPPGVS